MAVDQGLVEWVKEAMAPVGTVTSKRLFGGAALYLDGLAFAILAFDALWLKADAESAADWGDAERFSVTRENGKVQSLNYRRAPDETYDDADALRRWGLLAIEAARRAPPKKLGARKRARRRTRAGS
ncbi:MAG: TfoX/Sxy family protein [Bradyrhizobium sp.]|jgi:DNA transformation protein and related proteins|uniref:TfoX/Sxy family protein n=1 Tax=unclassified Sphingomonas TaxID=196159 RepID=UPI000A857645|nr:MULTISPECIES: TfoX/Sxy family protein [unclassified Sphingomonas]MCP4616794.1 TfoX/Sxy family protein [Bradyrhizobium sp.]